MKAVEHNPDAFRALFEAALDAVVIYDADRNVVEANPAAAELFGAPREELIGRTTYRFIASPGAGALRESFDRDGQLRAEFEIARPDGTRRYVEAVSRANFVEGRHLSILRDVTARRSSVERFSKAFRSSPVAIVLVRSKDQRYLEVNDAFVALVDRPRAELVGRTAQEIGVISRSSRDRIRQRREEGRSGAFDVEVRRPSGEVRQVRASTEDIEIAGEACVISVLHDVTSEVRARHELKKAEEQLRQAQKLEAIGSLAGGIAHDFNNLLSIVIGFVEMALDELAPNDRLRPNLEEIGRAGKQVAQRTRQLLAFSRRQVLMPKVVDLNELVSGVDRMLRRLVGASVEVTMQLAPNLGTVLIDPGQFEQVLLNLCANARDAMPKGGRLMIETANVDLDEAYASGHVGVAAGPHVLVAVTDTGIGMSDDTKSRIFEPFFTTKERGKGTGLGLATVFGIVKQHGGHVWVYSEPDHGTAFKLYFPRSDRAAEPIVPAPRASAASLMGHETILLVEDEDGVRAVAKSILRHFGYHVLEASTPGDAIIACEQFPAAIHLLLTDVVLPRMSGPVLAERLKRMKPDMRVLFMSGYTDDAIVHHGVLDSGVAFIEKPLMPDALGRKIRDVLAAPRSSA